VDGVGRVARRTPEGAQTTFAFACEPRLGELMVEKGSVAVDGVSLTIVTVAPDRDGFTVAVIPHTLAVTTLGEKAEGDPVHIECDVLAKWLRTLIAPYVARPSSPG
jgi:riboflavin synthase